MCHRGGWIFITSPNTVTPFHFDKEHNFILQIHGRKRIYVWDHRDTVVASEHSRDLFHLSNERYLLRWREEFRERARGFEQIGRASFRERGWQDGWLERDAVSLKKKKKT